MGRRTVASGAIVAGCGGSDGSSAHGALLGGALLFGGLAGLVSYADAGGDHGRVAGSRCGCGTPADLCPRHDHKLPGGETSRFDSSHTA
jgi:hypothetical protein